MTKFKANKIKRCLNKYGSYRFKDGSQIRVRETYDRQKEYVLTGPDHGLFNQNVIDVHWDIDYMLGYLSSD